MPKASRKWPADERFERELRAAFAQCVPSDSAVGRQLKQTPAAKRAKAPGAEGAAAAVRVPKVVLSEKRGPAPTKRRREGGDAEGGGGGAGKKKRRQGEKNKKPKDGL